MIDLFGLNKFDVELSAHQETQKIHRYATTSRIRDPGAKLLVLQENNLFLDQS